MSVSIVALVVAAALASPPEDEALPLTLAENAPAVDEVDAGYWSATLSPPQQRRAATAPFIDFSRLEITPNVGIAQWSGGFEATTGFVGSLQLRVPVPGFPGKRWGLLLETFYATLDRDQLPFYYTERTGSAFGFGVGADFEFYYSQSFFFRGQVGYLQVIFQDVVDVEDGGSLMGGIMLGAIMNRARSATYSFCYNPQLLYDSEDWVILHQFGLQIAF